MREDRKLRLLQITHATLWKARKPDELMKVTRACLSLPQVASLRRSTPFTSLPRTTALSVFGIRHRDHKLIEGHLRWSTALMVQLDPPALAVAPRELRFLVVRCRCSLIGNSLSIYMFCRPLLPIQKTLKPQESSKPTSLWPYSNPLPSAASKDAVAATLARAPLPVG